MRKQLGSTQTLALFGALFFLTLMAGCGGADGPVEGVVEPAQLEAADCVQPNQTVQLEGVLVRRVGHDAEGWHHRYTVLRPDTPVCARVADGADSARIQAEEVQLIVETEEAAETLASGQGSETVLRGTFQAQGAADHYTPLLFTVRDIVAIPETTEGDETLVPLSVPFRITDVVYPPTGISADGSAWIGQSVSLVPVEVPWRPGSCGEPTYRSRTVDRPLRGAPFDFANGLPEALEERAHEWGQVAGTSATEWRIDCSAAQGSESFFQTPSGHLLTVVDNAVYVLEPVLRAN